MIIAIDGPAGSGKSTTARAVANAANYAHLDTGAMYRAAGLAIQQKGISVEDREAERILENADIEIAFDSGSTAVFLDGIDVTDSIRASEVGRIASQVATLQKLRDRMVDQQRTIIDRLEKRYGGVVIEGRDIGTVVVPNADLKFFMTATIEERARRRMAQLSDSGASVSMNTIIREIEDRDERDRNREVAPLACAEDALILDTTELSMSEQVREIINQINQIH
ncbi:MAG: (d)CMP kinase [Rhodothermales bacterium]|nr:(d)CMP kinase [Rhodothermales bacterium]